MQSKSHWLVFSPNYLPAFRAGGQIQDVRGILERVPSNVDITLVTRDCDLGGTPIFEELSGKSVRDAFGNEIVYLPSSGFRFLRLLSKVVRGRKWDVVYFTGFWDLRLSLIPLNLRLFQFIRSTHIVVSPHGELDPGAISLGKARAKRIVLVFFRILCRKQNVYVHLTSEIEELNARKQLGASIKIVRESTYVRSSETYEENPKSVESDFVFVSRLSEKKGLILAIEAIAIDQSLPGLDIYGPIDDEDYWQKCMTIIDRNEIGERIRYRGELNHKDVPREIKRYGSLVLPTSGESFGHIIAEAISVGVVPIITTTTPWTNMMRQSGIPMIESVTSAATARAMKQWITLDISERQRSRTRLISSFETWYEEESGLTIFDAMSDLS